MSNFANRLNDKTHSKEKKRVTIECAKYAKKSGYDVWIFIDGKKSEHYEDAEVEMY